MRYLSGKGNSSMKIDVGPLHFFQVVNGLGDWRLVLRLEQQKSPNLTVTKWGLWPLAGRATTSIECLTSRCSRPPLSGPVMACLPSTSSSLSCVKRLRTSVPSSKASLLCRTTISPAFHCRRNYWSSHSWKLHLWPLQSQIASVDHRLEASWDHALSR